MNGPMQPRQHLDLIVFDFDGTLCDSVPVKTNAFYDLYFETHGPALAARVRDYHLANVGASRFDKIRHVETELLGSEPSDAHVDRIALAYSRLVEDAVAEAPLFGGVAEFLAAPPEGIPLALVSATPTAELRRIVGRKGLTHSFAAIEGSPASKQVILEQVIDRFAARSGSTLMVGDQPSDAEAASAVGAAALMIAPPAPWVESLSRVDDFTGAAQWIWRLAGPSS